MPKNKMNDLRNHLFETLEKLRDEDNPMDIKRALAVSTVAQTIIESAKAEIQFMEAAGAQVDTDFFGELGDRPRPRLMRGTGR